MDNAWGGFYQGGTYLLIGPHKSGRTSLSLQFAKETVNQNEVCLYFTNMRPKDLMIQAASISFDIQKFINESLLIVVRVSSPETVEPSNGRDETLAEYLKDIIKIVNQYKPSRMVFDEITPFVEFENLGLLRNTLENTVEKLEDSSITTLFVIAEPASELSESIVDSLTSFTKGILYLSKDKNNNSGPSGVLIITPNIGHTQGKFKSRYRIEPMKGVTFAKESRGIISNSKPEISISEHYTSLADFELPVKGISFSNVYSPEEFKLFLNNQIALFNSTGQEFTLVSIQLDKSAEIQKLLTLNQLKNAARLSTDKRDKVCVIGDKVLVLIVNSEAESLSKLISKIKNNLPDSGEEYISKISPHIFIFSVKVDDSIHNSEELFKLISAEDNFRPARLDQTL